MIEVEMVSDLSGVILGKITRSAIKSAGESAEFIAATARAKIKAGKKSGRMYNRKPKGLYQASAPGEAPADVTGDLAGSIEAHPVEGGFEVVAADPIAHTMEFGTAGGKVAARPFMTPSFEGEKVRVEAQVGAEVRAALV